MQHIVHKPVWYLFHSLRNSYFADPRLPSAATSKSDAVSNFGSGASTARRNKIPPPQTPLITFPIAVYSHRGGGLEQRTDGSLFMENTMPAFHNSVRLGADLLETDVQLTRDGQVVILHDLDMGRLFGSQYSGHTVAEFAYSELPPLKQTPNRAKALAGLAAAPPGADAVQVVPLEANAAQTQNQSSSCFGPARVFMSAGTQQQQQQQQQGAPPTPLPVPAGDPDWRHCCVPLLSDLLREFPSSPIQIDIKVATPGIVPAVLDLLRRYGRAGGGSKTEGAGGQILWGSFRHDVNTACYEAAPDIPLFTSAPRALYLLSCYRAGITSEVARAYESAIIVPLQPRFWKCLNLLDPGWFAWLQRQGVAVVVFDDVNSIPAFEQCRSAGANALCTDSPGLLRGWLQDNPLRPVVAPLPAPANEAAASL